MWELINNVNGRSFDDPGVWSRGHSTAAEALWSANSLGLNGRLDWRIRRAGEGFSYAIDSAVGPWAIPRPFRLEFYTGRSWQIESWHVWNESYPRATLNNTFPDVESAVGWMLARGGSTDGPRPYRVVDAADRVMYPTTQTPAQTYVIGWRDSGRPVWNREVYGSGRPNLFHSASDALAYAIEHRPSYSIAYRVFPKSLGVPFDPLDPSTSVAGPVYNEQETDFFDGPPALPAPLTSTPSPRPPQLETTMPLTPILTPDADPDAPFASISVRRLSTEGNRLFLVIDARKLHRLLDDIGVQVDGDRYRDRPSTGAAVATSQFTLSPEVFLRKQYPAKFSLSDVYSTPPTPAQLTKLCQSSYEVIRKILEHYQPIDISVRVMEKK